MRWVNLQVLTPGRRCRYHKGQAAVELAFLAASLALLLGVAIEMGRLGYLAMTLDDAARAGAQYGSQSYSTDGDTTGMKSAATTAASNINGATWWGSSAGFSVTASNFCGCSDGTVVTCTGTCSAGSPAIYVQVQTQANYVPMIGLPGLPAKFTMYGKSTMRVQ
jgi:Flp pilus assembly protein TadG